MRTRHLAWLAVVALPLVASAVQARVYIVKPDGTGDYRTIQAAVDAVAIGDVIHLTAGTFRGTGNRDIDFRGKAIAVMGNCAYPESVRIDCQGSQQDPHRGFVFQTNEGAGSVLECLTVENAYWTGNGGGMYCTGASPSVRDCVFRNCHATFGGGASCSGSAVTLTNCVFSGDTADTGGALYFYFCYSPSLDLTRCTFSSNSASVSSGAIFFWACQARLAGCTLCGNGGPNAAIALAHRSVVNLTNTIIAFGDRGASIWEEGGGTEADLTCCDIYGNAGGDWVPPIDGQLGQRGNIWADPLFCQDCVELGLQEDSPCAFEHNPSCGLIGAWPPCTPAAVARQQPAGSFRLLPPLPNPSGGKTWIRYTAPSLGAVDPVVVGIYDPAGRLVRRLTGSPGPEFIHRIAWDGRDGEGRALPAGVYLTRIESGGKTAAGKVTLAR